MHACSADRENGAFVGLGKRRAEPYNDATYSVLVNNSKP